MGSNLGHSQQLISPSQNGNGKDDLEAVSFLTISIFENLCYRYSIDLMLMTYENALNRYR